MTRHAFSIDFPKVTAYKSPVAPIYDVVWVPPYHLALVGPWYSRAMLGSLAPRVNGRVAVFWQVPDPRMFTLTVKIEIPRALRERNEWDVTLGGVPFRCQVKRPPSAPAGRLALMTLAKFDAPYIAEWLLYHQALGVEHAYVYNNGSLELHQALAPFRPFVTEVDWPYPYGMYSANHEPFWPADSHIWTQPPAMIHAALKYGQHWDWMAFLDADEFLCPLQHDTLGPVLDAVENRQWVEQMFQRLGAIELRGRWFGTSGHEAIPTGGVVANYLQCERGCTSPLKAIVRPDAVLSSAVHYFGTEGETVRVPESVLRFNHYRAISDHQNRRGGDYDREFTNEATDVRAYDLALKHGLLKLEE